MRDFQLRKDLERVVIDGFALPLGFAPPPGRLDAPLQGYTVSYVSGEEDEPDTYSFHVVVSHERIQSILHKAFDLLPSRVFGIVEIGSRDAYRSTDVYISDADRPVPLREFLRVWDKYEPFLLEDGSIAAGANSDEPFVEIFLDQWKGILIHVPLDMRDEVESMLHSFELDEVQQTWSSEEHEDKPGMPLSAQSGEEEEGSPVRPVLDLTDEFSPDIDELLLNLRHAWSLELNIDRESNIDDGGRNLGTTLWHAVVIVDPASSNGRDEREQGAYASIWATAGSLSEMERLIDHALVRENDWVFGEIYTIDRVAYDERPDELADLPPARRGSQVHLVTIEPWTEPTRPERKGDDAHHEDEKGRP